VQKIKIKGIITNDLDLNKLSNNDPKQYSRGFNHRPGILGNSNAGGVVTCKPYNSKIT